MPFSLPAWPSRPVPPCAGRSPLPAKCSLLSPTMGHFGVIFQGCHCQCRLPSLLLLLKMFSSSSEPYNATCYRPSFILLIYRAFQIRWYAIIINYLHIIVAHLAIFFSFMLSTLFKHIMRLFIDDIQFSWYFSGDTGYYCRLMVSADGERVYDADHFQLLAPAMRASGLHGFPFTR